MDTITSVASAVFWGVVTLSVLVFLHEGGHYLAARLCGVRVTEFFLGLPCRFNIHRVSKRSGTKFGVTALLLGGYAMICGMDPATSPLSPRMLTLVHRRGRIRVEDAARELGCTPDEAMDACAELMGWGSIAPVYHPERGERRGSGTYPTEYASMPRDPRGLTIYDGRRFDRGHATAEGEPWEPTMGVEEFFEAERSHTYLGKGFLKRAFMLVAGILVNIVFGFILLSSIYTVLGVSVTVNQNVVGSVEASSVAESLGISAGDKIVSVGGTEVSDWVTAQQAISDARGTGPFEIVLEHDGVERTVTTELGADQLLGINAPSQVIHLNPLDSARVSFAYVKATAESIAQLINPSQTMQVLDNSTSVVGISVMSAQMAAQGPSTYLSFAALISFSLGFMNLLPIPPLDGGKLLIEVIALLIRRPVPVKVQNALSYIGLFLFCALFVYVLRGDVLRFIM